MSADRPLSTLGHVPLLEGLDPERLEALESAGSTREVEAGEILVAEGRPVEDLFIVLRGELEVFLPKSPSRLARNRIARLGAGACVGEYSFVDKDRASASVAARVPTRVFAIPQVEFERRLGADPALGRTVYRNLLRLLVARLREANERLDLFRPRPSAEWRS